ncbi:MAG: helix-turn-helix transcriptional regulator [Candidatus Buchananbacteria bacterium]|nr:helix-turn-helix transcriptional regulator [Candidatus Buchananbacteria bacterium]
MSTPSKRLSHNIKHLRHRRNLSQEGLAREAQLTLSNVAKLEGGFNHNPTLETLAAVAKVLTRNSIDQLLK